MGTPWGAYYTLLIEFLFILGIFLYNFLCVKLLTFFLVFVYLALDTK